MEKLRLNEILPEGCYKPQNMKKKDVETAFLKGATVIGWVLPNIDEDNKRIFVQLGEGIIATLPFDETTIYPYTYSKSAPHLKIPLQIACLTGKVICAKVISIDNGNIVLSRKQNMQEALEVLKQREFLTFLVSNVRTSLVFGDVGHGIQACIFIHNLCKSHIKSATEICKSGDSIFVKVLSIDELGRFDVSYKDACPPYNPANYKKDDTIAVRITKPVDNTFSGFFAYVTPQVCGIVDYHSDLPLMRYGDIVECRVSSANANGLRLKFIRMLNKSTV